MKTLLKSICFFLFCCCFFMKNGTAQSAMKAESYAVKAANTLIHGINPATANQAQFFMNAWEFDNNSQQYMVDMTCTWYATGCFTCDESLHSMSGYYAFDTYGALVDMQLYELNESAERSVTNTMMLESFMSILLDDNE